MHPTTCATVNPPGVATEHLRRRRSRPQFRPRFVWPQLRPRTLPSTWLQDVIVVDGVHDTTPWKKWRVNLLLSSCSAHAVNDLVVRAEHASLAHELEQNAGLPIFGLEARQRIAQVFCQRANATMPFLLFVFALAAVGARHVREANRVGVKEHTWTPPSVLRFLDAVLIKKLGNNCRTDRLGHMDSNLMHPALCDLAGAQRIIF
mmetsp:Transcript_40967/g.112616  ORF Transcript_40967/g.112616 Transcript_40967/m.112616 type:complete len:204 (+) Transcript_40967:423-1034(+)